MIRPVRSDDAADLAAIYGPVVADTPVSFEVDPPSPEEMRRRVLATVGTLPWLVAERAGRVAGYAYAAPHRDRAAYRWSVDTSVYVAEAERGAGIGRALYDALLAALAELGYVTAYAGITLPNPASERLHAAVGFQPVGVYPRVGWKLGRWHDVGWFHRPLRDPLPDHPSPPRPWAGGPVPRGS